jgi:acetyltransferase-like isoleucine patch superfamily enzyme
VLDADRRLISDWYPGTVPLNVSFGEGAYLESSFSFSRYRSEADPGLRMGSGAAAYVGTMFDVGPRGRVDIGSCALLVAVRIECDLRIEIGDGSLLSWNVVLMDGYRWPMDPQRRRLALGNALRRQERSSCLEGSHRPRPRPICIGRNVWIGFGACVLPGVAIGDGAVIGARSVVAEDVAPNAVVAGNPARFVRSLS